jgi:hypothetical protein
MKSRSIVLFAMGLSLAGPVTAADPNIKPGMWETTSTMTMKSAQFPMPPHTQTVSECVTEEKVSEGQAFLEQDGDCTVSRKDLRADGMDYTMTCMRGEEGTLTMNASMRFNGDTMSGSIEGNMESPMGEMIMNMELSGRRTGSCAP